VPTLLIHDDDDDDDEYDAPGTETDSDGCTALVC
jgi:hypothetical protein